MRIFRYKLLDKGKKVILRNGDIAFFLYRDLFSYSFCLTQQNTNAIFVSTFGSAEKTLCSDYDVIGVTNEIVQIKRVRFN